MQWHESIFADRDGSIKQQNAAIENLSTLIEQKDKKLDNHRHVLTVQMMIIDKLNNKISFLINKKEESVLVDWLNFLTRGVY
ncbi:hypothetical protein V4B17_02565 [Bartonella sp. B23]